MFLDVLHRQRVACLKASNRLMLCPVVFIRPPDVAFEPETALYGGADGLDFYRSISANWSSALRKSGWLVYEIGKGQEQDVAAILRQHGFSRITQQMDGNGIVRVVAGQK